MEQQYLGTKNTITHIYIQVNKNAAKKAFFYFVILLFSPHKTEKKASKLNLKIGID